MFSLVESFGETVPPMVDFFRLVKWNDTVVQAVPSWGKGTGPSWPELLSLLWATL